MTSPYPTTTIYSPHNSNLSSSLGTNNIRTPVFLWQTTEPVFESQTSHSRTTLLKIPASIPRQYNSNTVSTNIVLHGNSRKWTGRDPRGNIMILPPVTMEEQIAVQRETKARTILLQSLPEDHMADFHHLDDAKDIWLAVKARFGGNEESKKMRKSMLKQEFADFKISESEGLHKGYDSLGTLEIDVKGRFPCYDSEFPATPTHSAFIRMFLKMFFHLFCLLKCEPQQQLPMKTLTNWQVGFGKLDIKWQMAMRSFLFRINRFERRLVENIKFNNKDVCQRLDGVVPDVMFADGVFVLMSYGSDGVSVATGVGIDGVSVPSSDATDAETQFAFMGLSPQVQSCPFGCNSMYTELKKDFDNLEVQYKECFIQVQAYKSSLQNIEQQKSWYQNNQLALEEKIRILTTDLSNTTNMLKYTEKLNEQAKIDNMNNKVKLEKSNARFDKWKESSKNLVKLINSSMSSRSKFGMLRGNLSIDWFGQPVGMHAVPPPITGTFMPPSNKPDIGDTQFTYGSKSNNGVATNSVPNDFVSCDNSDKSSDSESTGFASCVSSVKSSSLKTKDQLPSASSLVDLKNLHKTDNQGPSNDTQSPSFSFQENVKIPRNLCNRNGSNNIKNIPSFVPRPAYVPAGSRNRPTYVPAGRPFPTGWHNPAARPMTEPEKAIIFNRQSSTNRFLGGIITFGGGEWSNQEKAPLGLPLSILRMFYYVEELKNFNLFSGPHKSVVLRVPRRHNLYCFNLTDIHSEREIKCLLAKASLDESTKWHRRMAHVNFKNMNKLAKHGLGVSTISEPLQLLHMDLFGPTSIRSIDHKHYSLVVTDDFSRFSWVFFLGTKDETFYILRDFITFVENQLTKKVKAIRCDNGTEFKNSNLIELCGSKGIKRDYSVARTPQQNGVAERKNRTLIEAARTMLAALRSGVSEWYFDLDIFTDSLGYTRFKSNQPAGTQDTNTHAGTHDDSDSECDEQVIVVPSFPSKTFTGPGHTHTASATVESTSDYAEELARLQGQAYEANSAAKDTWKTTDTVPAVSGVPATTIPAGSINQAASGSAVPSIPSSFVVELVHADDTPLPPDMDDTYHHPTTGIFSKSTYDADFGGSVTNLAPTIDVDPVPTRRVHTVHPISHIIGDITSPVLTRGTLKKSKFGESALAGYVHDQQRNNHTDYLHCLFACFLSQLEPSRLWEACALCQKGKLLLGRNRFLRIKEMPESCESFVWSSSSTKGLVYVDDIIFGSTNQTWCDEFEVLMKGEFKMSAIGELTFFLGLQVKQQPDGISISQDKYVQDMLKKFDMESVRTATTPYEASKPKSKDELDDDVNVHLYRSMIGSLMYLTASRPDIMFAVSACSRHQYPRDSPFVLEAYSDSDYAGSNGDRKSTTGGCQFLGTLDSKSNA
ncbi:putative ribonuclease H-like domain-containing protein [Tanacetum coccineum]